MAAYAAVISLKHTINGLLNSSSISLVSSTREILEPAYNDAKSLQQVLERSNDNSRSKSSNERVDGLEGQVRDFAHKLEDALEYHELNPDDDEEVIKEEIASFSEAVKEMEKDYIEELSGDDDDNDDNDDDDDDLSRIDFGVEMVGHSTLFTDIRGKLVNRMRPYDLWFFAFLGEVGTGRTLAAKALFEELRNDGKQLFDCCAWVKVGSKYELKEVMISIITQVDTLTTSDHEVLIPQEDDDLLSKYLYKLLDGRKYLIVLDDVDDVELVNYLRRNSFPDQNNGSLVLLTTALLKVANLADHKYRYDKVPSYFLDNMWFIIRHWFFDSDSVSGELEVAAKKIIQNCQCRQISFIKTLLFLLNSDKTVEEWSKIAADNENPIFMVGDEISETRQIKVDMQYSEEPIVDLLRVLVDFSTDNVSARMNIYPTRFFSKMQIISFFGMAGIGKSAFVKYLSKDESILSHYDHHVWITLGPNYQTTDILLDILAQVYPDIQMKGDELLVMNLCERLSCKRCLIVLDDLWSKEPLHHLKNIFPNIKGTTLLTTRLAKVAKFDIDDTTIEMQLLGKEESWYLLRQKVFGRGLCLSELEKVGRKIAEKCDGLPLLILIVAEQLLKVEISKEYWENVASGKQKSVFMNAHHQISKALLPSYRSLPQHLKPCFLYMGVFREIYEIPASNLTSLWISEGFLESNPPHMLEDFIIECLSELSDISLIMVQLKDYAIQIKTYRLHSVFWHLSNSQGTKNKFYHAMNSYDACSIEMMKSQRRLCIRNNILLGMKYVQNSMASNTSAHSLLCVGPFHQYPVPLNFELRLLRVMNALTIRFYEFPVKVVWLFHMRYLGLTCNGYLPSSISNLRKLQYLIVKRHINIKDASKNFSQLPVEIWDMKELKHLQFVGGCLPNHKCGTGLLKLSTLLDVSPQSCRTKVLKWIPNLKRLGIRIELVPGDEGQSFRCLNRISRLHKLESLKCVVVNPQIGYEVVAPPIPLSMFPSNLKKLSLGGLGYPWEYLYIIGELRSLEVLKLKNYAFQGPRWEVETQLGSFDKLKFLLVEDTDLVHWKVSTMFLLNIQCLRLKHCYKLKDLPMAIGGMHLRKIEIVDCNPLTEAWAEQMGSMTDGCTVYVHNSWFVIPTKNDFQLHHV